MTYNAFRECLPEPNKIFPFENDEARRTNIDTNFTWLT